MLGHGTLLSEEAVLARNIGKKVLLALEAGQSEVFGVQLQALSQSKVVQYCCCRSAHEANVEYSAADLFAVHR